MARQEVDPTVGLAREERVRFAWLARLFGRLLAWYIRSVARSVRFSGPPVNQGQVVFAIWHESNLVMAVAARRLREDFRIISFSTRRFRGIVMNTMLTGLDAGAVTLPDAGAQSRAEAASVSRLMAGVGRSGRSLVVSCDGPTGPYRMAKPGVLIVARESGLPVQPWAIAVRPPFRLVRRWDRQLVPLPFSRMRVDEGRVFEVGTKQRIKPVLIELQAELERIAALSDRRMSRRSRRGPQA